MYKSYLKIGWRNLLRNKGYSFINIGGLTAGLAITILIGLWIHDELTFNRYADHYSSVAQVYRKETREDRSFATTFQTTGLFDLLKSQYSSAFEQVVLMNPFSQEVTITSGTNKFPQAGYFMQPEGIDMFSVKMLAGDGNALKNITSILLSQSLSKKLFNDADPLGKIISMDGRTDLMVAGIYEDLPANSEFGKASFFAPIEIYTSNLNTWDNYNVKIFVRLKEGHTAASATSLIQLASKPFIPADRKQELFLHPMSKWHLSSEFKDGNEVTSSQLQAVWYCGMIGVFVLLLACINFMNLSTARSERRMKEVGVRKVMGSLRGQLIYQFYSEAFIVSAISFVSALLIASLCLSSFNSLTGKNIEFPFDNVFFWIAGGVFILFTTLIAGSYPALYLSSFQPIRALKGQLRATTFALSSRKVLVVFQFTVSIALTIGTIVVYQQIQHAKNRPIGYSKDNLIGLRAVSPEFKGKSEVLRNKLKATGAVEEMAEANYSITETLGANDGFSWKDKIYDESFNTIRVSPEYGKTIGWEFIDGRDFSREIASDVSSGVIINESALKILGIPNAVGEQLHYNYAGKDGSNYTILGVVKDMVKGSPYAPTIPSIIFCSTDDLFWMYIKLSSKDSPHESLQKIARVFDEVVPSAAFDYRFADDEYNAKFQSEARIGNLALVFTVLAVLISCLGLTGLAAFSASARSKELGIRKIVGASVMNLFKLMTLDFVVLVIIGCVIAIPLSVYAMNTWLKQFDFRITVSVGMLLCTGLGAVALTLITVSYHAVHAAMVNPVNSLRAE